MIEEERLERLLHEALPVRAVSGPSRDLWPEIVARAQAAERWSWLDLGIAAAVVLALLWRPGWLWLVLYHL